jgi:hypothetical protein
VLFRSARESGSPVILAGDIDKGGVFASLVGTLELLDEDERRYVKGMLINKFRGEVALLKPAVDFIEQKTGRPVLGIIPWFKDIRIAQEDSVYLDERQEEAAGNDLRICVIRLPHIANFDDFDPLRREPDVVMVSDCLDRETAHLAVKAAQDGKRIYLGIQAKDSFDALKKLISLAGDTDGVASTLRGITGQRLIRKLCIACRVSYKPDVQILKKANLPVDKIDQFYRPPKPEEMVDEKGNPRVCPNCQNSGYFGRVGLFELLVVDDPMRELIRNGQPVNNIRAQARKGNMLYLQEVGVQKVIQGVTAMNEMLRVLRDDDNTVRKGG